MPHDIDKLDQTRAKKSSFKAIQTKGKAVFASMTAGNGISFMSTMKRVKFWQRDAEPLLPMTNSSATKTAKSSWFD